MASERVTYQLKGNYLIRTFALSVIFLIFFTGVFCIQFIGFIILLPITAALFFGLMTIRFPTITVFEEYFRVEHRSLINQFSSHKQFEFRNIHTVDYIKGRVDWSLLKAQTFVGTAAYGGFSDPDRIILRLTDNEFAVIYRIGSRADFLKLSEIFRIKSGASSAA